MPPLNQCDNLNRDDLLVAVIKVSCHVLCR